MTTRIALALTSLLFAACADGTAGDDAVTDGDADQQLAPAGGKGDGATPSKDSRIVNCHLEYEAFTPAFAIRPAAQIERTFGEIENTGIVASDGAFSLRVHTNPHPPYNLSFIAQIVDDAKSAGLSYIVLPRPHVGGAFLFELGASIPPVSFADTGEIAFDNLRAYCSIRMP
jgi:hypothetical protein